MEEFIDSELRLECEQQQENEQAQDEEEEEDGLIGEKMRRLDELYEMTFGDEIRRAVEPSVPPASDYCMGDVDNDMAARRVRAADVLEFRRQRSAEEWDALVKSAVERIGASSWTRFQSDAAELKLEIDGMRRELMRREWEWANARPAGATKSAGTPSSSSSSSPSPSPSPSARIVLITGFESFNVSLYRNVAEELQRDGIDLQVFSDRDIVLDYRSDDTSEPDPRLLAVERALSEADVFFGSLLFDYDQVCWLKERIDQIPLRVSFESALELMGTTQLGSFQMNSDGKAKGGPPPIVQKLLAKFGSGREEDKLVG